MVLIKKHIRYFLLVTTIMSPGFISAQNVTMIDAIQQAKAQLHDLSENQQEIVIRQIKSGIRDRRKLIDQKLVTEYIKKAQERSASQNQSLQDSKNSDTLNATLANSKKTAQINEQKELARIIEESKQDAYAKIFDEHPVYGLIIQKMNALRDLPIVQLCACNETNPLKSGGHSIRNAWAIASLVNENIPLNAEIIQERAKTRPEIIEHIDGDIDGIMTRAEILNLSSAYLVECTDNKLIGYYIDAQPQLIPFSILHVQQLLRSYKEVDHWVISFIGKLGNQYFLISLVKQSGQEKPVMFYLDPQNRQLEHNSYIHKCVQEIHRICFEQSRLTQLLQNIQQHFVQPIVHAVNRIAQWVRSWF